MSSERVKKELYETAMTGEKALTSLMYVQMTLYAAKSQRTYAKVRGEGRAMMRHEEHSIVGGFGSAVCEVAAETGNPCRIHRIGMEDVYSTIVGTQQYLRAQYQMDDEAIARRAAQWLREE